MMRAGTLLFFLVTLWLALSGHWRDPLLCALGLASSLLVLFVSLRMDKVDATVPRMRTIRIMTLYWPWLFGEIVKANLAVMRRILTPGWMPDARVMCIEISARTDVGQALLANSITLTPGTVTVEAEEDAAGVRSLVVHALDPSFAPDILAGVMDSRTQSMERLP